MAPDRSIYEKLLVLKKEGDIKAARSFCYELIQSSGIYSSKIATIDAFCVSLVHQDPHTAIEILEQRMDRFPDSSIGLPLSGLAACYSQIGDRKNVIRICNYGLKLDIPRRAKVNLLTTLRKYQSVSKHLPDLFRSFNVASDGVDMLGKIHELAKSCADLVQAEKTTALIQKCYEAGEIAAPHESARTHLLWCGNESLNIQVTQQVIHRHHGEFQEAFRRPGKRSKTKITIGYLSADFRDHPTSHLMMGAWRHHDRNRFEILFFDVGWDDKSTTRSDLEQHCDDLVSLSALSDKKAAALIRSKAVDVLIELNGPTQSNRLGILKYRPAPVLIGYLGWPGSYGGGVVEYIIGDDYIWPTDRTRGIPEKIIRLKGAYQINDHRACETFGGGNTKSKPDHFAGSSFVFGNMNNINKVTLECWDVWMHILKQCQSSVLLLLDPGGASRNNLMKLAKRYSVAADRIQWAPRSSRIEYLARTESIDLILDCWPYGGHTTTSDALSVGVPVLTLEGTNFAGRVAGSLIKDAGLGKILIADSIPKYSTLACSFFGSPQHLAEVKQFMKVNLGQCGLFDSQKRTRNLEQVIEGLIDV